MAIDYEQELAIIDYLGLDGKAGRIRRLRQFAAEVIADEVPRIRAAVLESVTAGAHSSGLYVGEETAKVFGQIVDAWLERRAAEIEAGR